MSRLEFTVLDNAGIRIDKYLSEVQDELTRSKIQSLIKDELILVNGNSVLMSYKVKLSDEIVIEIPDITNDDIIPENIKLDVLYEDDDVLVINKPKGMVVHPAAGNYSGTLVNALLYHFNTLSNRSDNIRPGIVHRIDKNTSGCIIVCKNDKAHNDIAYQIKEKICKRTYIALVHGIIEHETGTINAPIGRSKNDRQKMAVTNLNSKEATTDFRVLKRFVDYSLIECTLRTGRTHQIRVHMQYIKHPIVGDDKYSYQNTRKDTCGQMLHAIKIEFNQPTSKERIVVECGIPEYFKKVLEEIEGK